MKTLCLRRFRLCLGQCAVGLTLPPTGPSAATLIWKTAASGSWRSAAGSQTNRST